MLDSNLSPNIVFLLDFTGLLASLVSLILCLRIVWRVEKKLDRFFKILTVTLTILMLGWILRILSHVGAFIIGPFYFNALDILAIVAVMFGLIIMNGLIKDLDGER